MSKGAGLGKVSVTLGLAFVVLNGAIPIAHELANLQIRYAEFVGLGFARQPPPAKHKVERDTLLLHGFQTIPLASCGANA